MPGLFLKLIIFLRLIWRGLAQLDPVCIKNRRTDTRCPIPAACSPSVAAAEHETKSRGAPHLQPLGRVDVTPARLRARTHPLARPAGPRMTPGPTAAGGPRPHRCCCCPRAWGRRRAARAPRPLPGQRSVFYFNFFPVTTGG